MAVNSPSIVGRGDLYRVNPLEIKVVDGWNSRKDFSGHDELKNSILANGVLVPLRLRKDENDDLWLVDGERRLRAVIEAIKDGNNIESVPAIIERRTMGQVDAMFLQVTANDGKRFTPSEEGAAFKKLLGWGVTPEAIAGRIGRGKDYVDHRIALSDAAPSVQEAVDSGQVGIMAALNIALENHDVEEQTAQVQKHREQRKIKTADFSKLAKYIRREVKRATDNGFDATDEQIQELIEAVRELRELTESKG